MKEDFSHWLGDIESRSTPSHPLTEALDALYAQGPAGDKIQKAQLRLRNTFRKEITNMVYFDVLPDTPMGDIFIAVTESGLFAVDFGVTEAAFLESLPQISGEAPVRSPVHVSEYMNQLKAYFAGESQQFDLPIDQSTMTEFQWQVFQSALQIPYGHTSSYGEIARKLGKPNASRAVGQALGRNPMPIVIPCHRVVAADGSLRGYSAGGGIQAKAALLTMEGVNLS